MKYPEKVERRPDRMAAVRYPRKWDADRVEWRLRHPGGMAAVRHPEKMGCRPGMIALRYPGGISDAIN